jgi:uncharacterized membrane protein YhaH (DUF805 family)
LPESLTDLEDAFIMPSYLVRRLHDTGRSGWWYLIGLIPIGGIILLLIWTVGDSQADINKYGPSPKLAEQELHFTGDRWE